MKEIWSAKLCFASGEVAMIRIPALRGIHGNISGDTEYDDVTRRDKWSNALMNKMRGKLPNFCGTYLGK